MHKELIQKLKSHNKVAVFSHVRPDGDCLGSQVAMCLWLQKNGVEAVAYNADGPSQNLMWLADIFPIDKPEEQDLAHFDAFLVVDGNALHRFGEVAEKIEQTGAPIYMIDHHPQPDDVFTEMASDMTASSTCEIVHRIYTENDPSQIDEQSAKAMYVGIVTDTGSFQFDSVKPATMKAASDLLNRGGFTPNEVMDKVYATKSLNEIKLLGLSLETLNLHEDQQIASMYVTQAMFNETNTTAENTEGFVAYPMSIDGVKACIFMREEEHRIKLSLRSRSDIDVNEWARQMNGGGHKKAAGASYQGTLEEALQAALKIGRKQWT